MARLMNNNSRRRRRRRRRRANNQREDDRLSKLPDDMLLLVLSQMETKDAVKTGILSKRWKDLWIKLDRLIYNNDDKNQPWEREDNIRYDVYSDTDVLVAKNPQYLTFVDHTLMKCISPSIKTFYLNYFVDVQNPDHRLHTWIERVLEKQVEDMALRFAPDEPGTVPDSLYQSSTLTSLELENVELRISCLVNWRSLRSLCLMHVHLQDDQLLNMLFGSPVLETIDLRTVNSIAHIKYMPRNVKKLKLVDFHDVDDEAFDGVLEVRAPWLEELEILRQFLVVQFQLVDVSSLVKATLDFTTFISEPEEVDEMVNLNEEELDNYLVWNRTVNEYNIRWIPMVARLLQSVSHVNELILGSEPIQVLSLTSMQGEPSPLFKCRHVTITSPLWKYEIPGIQYLLENGPNIETLSITVKQKEYDLPLGKVLEMFKNRDLNSIISTVEFVNLKKVKIYLEGDNYTGCLDFEIVKSILRSAVSLEKLALCSSPESHCRSRMFMLANSVQMLLVELKGGKWEYKQINDTVVFSFPKSI